MVELFRHESRVTWLRFLHNKRVFLLAEIYCLEGVPLRVCSIFLRQVGFAQRALKRFDVLSLKALVWWTPLWSLLPAIWIFLFLWIVLSWLSEVKKRLRFALISRDKFIFLPLVLIFPIFAQLIFLRASLLWMYLTRNFFLYSFTPMSWVARWEPVRVLNFWWQILQSIIYLSLNVGVQIGQRKSL